MTDQWKVPDRKAKPTVHGRYRRTGLLVALTFVIICGCSIGLVKDLKISSYAQKQQVHKLIQTLQPMLDRGEPLSSFRLFLLASAYYDIRDYQKMFRTTDLLQRQIDKGDVGGYGGNLTVYSEILRGYAYLDQELFHKALDQASKAMVLRNRIGKKKNSFDQTQRIDISCIAGVASALTGHMRDADAYLKAIDDIPTAGEIFGPEKYIAEAKIYMAKKDYRSASRRLS